MRGQGSLEYLIITAAVLAISAVVVLFLTGALGGGATGAQLSACKQAASSCAVQLATAAGAACAQCNTACVDAAGKDIMSGASGCGVACGFCKQGKTMRVSGSLPAGIVGFWPFEENTGTSTADLSGNANTGTINNGAAWASGKRGYALQFDGVDDYVDAGTGTSLNLVSVITVEAWIYPVGYAIAPGAREIATRSSAPTNGYYTTLGPDKKAWIYMYGLSSPGWHKSVSDIPLNQWTHVAFTYDGSSVKVFVNGVKETETPSTGGITASPGPLYIGWLAEKPSNRPFKGIIDEIRIYNRALTETEIRSLFSSA